MMCQIDDHALDVFTETGIVEVRAVGKCQVTDEAVIRFLFGVEKNRGSNDMRLFHFYNNCNVTVFQQADSSE